MKQYNKINNLVGWLAFLIAACTYCMTIEPTASFWDCPEFITTGYKLEVGHPPGAPFFMLTANLFSQFTSDPSQVARMVNIMSALMSAACILFLFWSITHLAKKLICPDALNPAGDYPVTIGRNEIKSGTGINSDFDTDVLNGDCFGVRKTKDNGAMAMVNGKLLQCFHRVFNDNDVCFHLRHIFGLALNHEIPDALRMQLPYVAMPVVAIRPYRKKQGSRRVGQRARIRQQSRYRIVAPQPALRTGMEDVGYFKYRIIHHRTILLRQNEDTAFFQEEKTQTAVFFRAMPKQPTDRQRVGDGMPI